MASERQIAANRRNAQKSTGPRSAAGKRRASRNAYRHGLAAAVGQSGSGVAEIDAPACAIAVAATGSVIAATDAEILAFARSAAQAERELARIRALKGVAMSALMVAANLPVAAIPHPADMGPVASAASGEPLFEASPAAAALRLPSSGPTPDPDALHGSLTEVLILDRYEQRATARRDRVVRNIIARSVLMTVFESSICQNESNLAPPVARAAPLTQAKIVIGRTNPISSAPRGGS
jgi:hypothetical protein